MPRITIHVGGRERLEPTISKAAPGWSRSPRRK
jgi:hypothetical protein